MPHSASSYIVNSNENPSESIVLVFYFTIHSSIKVEGLQISWLPGLKVCGDVLGILLLKERESALRAGKLVFRCFPLGAGISV